METINKSIVKSSVSPVALTGIYAKANQQGNKYYQVEFSQLVKDARPNILALLNEGDSRFEGNLQKPRKAWMMATPQAISKYTGINIDQIEALEVGEKIEVIIENFKLGELPVNIQVTELTESEVKLAEVVSRGTKANVNYTLLLDNKAKKAKQIPASERGTHRYFVKNGELVFSMTSVVPNEPVHTLITDATLVEASELFPVEATADIKDAVTV